MTSRDHTWKCGGGLYSETLSQRGQGLLPSAYAHFLPVSLWLHHLDQDSWWLLLWSTTIRMTGFL
ncbi:hypothetical protein ACJX0J_028534, partial [Zea mays]